MKLSPDAIGFIFWPKSPRGVSAEEVAEWTNGKVPNGIRKVGVFVDTPVDEIHEIAAKAELDVIQLHGPYTPYEISDIDLPVWRVLHVDRLPEDWNEVDVEALLVDSGTIEIPGGTGMQVDLDRAKEMVKQSKFPVLLAGGLKPDTVGSVIESIGLHGVDVSSGVESRPGVKDMEAVRAFIQNARDAFSS